MYVMLCFLWTNDDFVLLVLCLSQVRLLAVKNCNMLIILNCQNNPLTCRVTLCKDYHAHISFIIRRSTVSTRYTLVTPVRRSAVHLYCCTNCTPHVYPSRPLARIYLQPFDGITLTLYRFVRSPICLRWTSEYLVLWDFCAVVLKGTSLLRLEYVYYILLQRYYLIHYVPIHSDRSRITPIVERHCRKLSNLYSCWLRSWYEHSLLTITNEAVANTKRRPRINMAFKYKPRCCR